MKYILANYHNLIQTPFILYFADAEGHDQTKVYCLSKSGMTGLMDPKFYCGNWQPFPCQKQCDGTEGTSCWIHQPQHHYGQHQEQHDEDPVNSLSKTECQESAKQSSLM